MLFSRRRAIGKEPLVLRLDARLAKRRAVRGRPRAAARRERVSRVRKKERRRGGETTRGEENPRARRRVVVTRPSRRVPRSLFASSGESLVFGMVTTTACCGATRGGKTNPLSSPCTMMATPMVRVVHPQEFCHGIDRPPVLFSNSI